MGKVISYTMKKFLLILLAFSTLMSGYSQTEKGKMFLGGQFNLSGNTNSLSDTLSRYDNHSLNFAITPNFGYFIADNLALGVSLDFGVDHSNNHYENTNLATLFRTKSNSINNSYTYGIGGFARYYVNITDHFKFYVNGGLKYSHQTDKRTSFNNYPGDLNSPSIKYYQEFQLSFITLEVTPGLVYFVTPRLGLQANFGNLSLRHSRSKDITSSNNNYYRSNDYGFNLNPSTLSIGLNYYF